MDVFQWGSEDLREAYYKLDDEHPEAFWAVYQRIERADEWCIKAAARIKELEAEVKRLKEAAGPGIL